MANLLHAENGVVSLELSEQELPELSRLIKKNWGRPNVIRHATFDSLTIAGQNFTFENEWNAPCLISGTAEGAEILKMLCFQLDPK